LGRCAVRDDIPIESNDKIAHNVPNPVPALLLGSQYKEGVLEFGLIGRGLRFMFLLNDELPITTTRVLRIHVDRPAVVAAASSPSIH
jgi:hypothetical protein